MLACGPSEPLPAPGRPLPTARLAAALALLLALSSPLVAETWYERYHQAEKALEEERWSDAVAQLNAALEENHASSSSARTYGMRFIEYYPFLKLAVAYYHLGQSEAALQALETEERQGRVQDSKRQLALLESYRQRIEAERARATVARRDRARDVVAESLEQARRLEAEGAREDALAALGRALAVEPEHAEAVAARGRLLAALAEERRRRDEEQQLASLLGSGRKALGEKRFGAAAASFEEALELRPLAEARALLAEARQGLRAELEARRSGEERRQLLERSLRRATELEARGAPEAALAEVQTALALAPESAPARRLQERLLEAQAAEQERSRSEGEIRSLLAEAEERAAAGELEEVLRTANRVLVLDPANAEALRYIARAYGRLSRGLLAVDAAPPTILLEGAAAEGGAASEPLLVRSPEVLLTGTAYDSSPVEVRVLAGGEEVGRAELRQRELQGVWRSELAWRHELPPGLSELVVQAVDEAGNRAAVELAYLYRVPFLRTPYFPASVAAAVAGLVAVLILWRARRRRKLLLGRFNPYIAGAPIFEEGRFYGRRDLMDYVLRRISNNSIMLYGERRIGKTSFQHRLKDRLGRLEDPEHEFHPVYVDLQGIPQEKFFATLAAEIFHELAPKLGGLEPPPSLVEKAYGYRDLVRDLHRVLRALGERTKKKVKLVLLIDEVDELNDYDPRVNQRLRSLFMRAFADNLVSVVSGVGIKKQWEREGSPWYNFFQEVEVKPLRQDDARTLIETPLRGIFVFESGVANEIIRRTESKPYLIQRLCSGLVDRMHTEGRRTITMVDLEAACRIEGL